MIKKFSIVATLFAFICILPSASIAGDKAAETYENHLVLKLIGTGEMFFKDVGLGEDAMCFNIDLVDMKSKEIVGDATDCLSSLEEIGTGIRLIGTTIFRLPDGDLVTRGNITAQPTLVPTTVANELEPAQVMDHVTGSAREGNTIISGTGKYKNAKGNARLSGLVNVSGLTGAVGDPMAFSCIFDIELDDYR